MGSPSRSGMRLASRFCFLVTPSNAPSLKTLQFWKTSTNAAPSWAWARWNVSIMCWRSMSCVRATNEASAPSATASGLNGASSEPIGELLVTLPISLVGLN